MKRNMKARNDRALLLDDLEPDDFFASSREKSHDRKTRQLCAQVQRALTLLVEGESDDEGLQGLYVESVEPYPNAARLLVVLRQWDQGRALDLKTILARLAGVKGYWRAEVGHAVNRKKAPDLFFQVLLAGAEL